MKFVFYLPLSLALLSSSLAIASKNPPCVPALLKVMAKPLRTSISIAVIGAGDVVNRYVEPGIEALRQKIGRENVRVTFIDKSEYWKAKPLEAKMTGIIESLVQRGGTYFDKSSNSEAEFASFMQSQNFDYIFVETPDVAHISDMRQLISIYGDSLPTVFFDKPFGADEHDVFMFLGELSKYPNRFYGIDHFKAMLSPEFLKSSAEYLGGEPEKIIYRLEENHTSMDGKYVGGVKTSTSFLDAIRNENRATALAKGLFLDLAPHGFADFTPFVKLKSATLKWVRAARYKDAPIPTETWAEAGYEFESASGKRVQAVIIAGKGIKGVRSLGPDFDDQTFSLELIKGNRRVLANLTDGKTHFFKNGTRIKSVNGLINTVPYNVILEEAFRDQRTTLLNPDEAFQVLREIGQVRTVIVQKLDQLPVIDPLVYEEDLSNVPVLWGKSPSSSDQH